MKKKTLIIIGIIIGIAFTLSVIFFIGSGLTKNPNVEIINYSVNEDGSELKFTIGIPSSIGYVRGYKNKGGGVKSHYLNFYNTFGVISSIGSKFEYVLELDEDDTEIYFNRTGGGYELVLRKNDYGEWVKADDNYTDYELVKDLKKVDYASTEILVKYNEILYGKSNAIIDYSSDTEPIGIIAKVIDSEYVPKHNGETNQIELKDAEVHEANDKSMILKYNNEYVLFNKLK